MNDKKINQPEKKPHVTPEASFVTLEDINKNDELRNFYNEVQEEYKENK